MRTVGVRANSAKSTQRSTLLGAAARLFTARGVLDDGVIVTSKETRMAAMVSDAAAWPAPATPKDTDWTKPAALALPKGGFFPDSVEQGRYGPVFPRTPANYGFSILAKVKPGHEQAIRDYGRTIEAAVAADPTVLAPLKLHYLRWLLFPIGHDTYFMYQGIFDTDFDKYLEDAVALFMSTGVTTVFVHLEDFPENWQGNVPMWIKYFREHQCPSFLEYGEYPYVSADEIKKALALKAKFSEMLDLMQ
jgi:hypothetical protein